MMTEACGWCCLVGSGSPALSCPGLCMHRLPRSHCCPPHGLPALDWHNREQGTVSEPGYGLSFSLSLLLPETQWAPTAERETLHAGISEPFQRFSSCQESHHSYFLYLFCTFFCFAREWHTLAEAISYNSHSEEGYDRQEEQTLQKHSSWQNLSAKLTQVSTVSYAETLTEKYDADLLITGLVNTKEQLTKTFILQVTLKITKICIYIIITYE